jgi:F-type H+-transporting ATPase subunit epsilon
MIKLDLVTLHGIKSSGEVHEVLLPTPLGQIAVFENHAPLVSIASPGIIKVRVKPNDPDDFMEVFATNGGVIEVEDNAVRVLVDEADAPEEINEQEAQKAVQDAKDLLANAKDQVSLDNAMSMIERTATRLKVAELKRRRRRN